MTKTLLAILAHPDDESFGLGGTLALYSQKGYNTYYVCATRGEAGTVDEEHLHGFNNTAELRTAELECATIKLGLKDVIFLGYRDSGMPDTEDNKHPDAQINHSVDEVAGRIVKYIRDLKPDIVITHDPIGGYRHPDHIHVHKATKLAFEKSDDASFHPEAGSPFKPRALYYQIFPRSFLRWAVRLLPLFGRNPRNFGTNHDVDLVALTEFHFPTHVKIDIRSVAEIKQEAIACHVSQGGGLTRRGPMGFLTRLFGQYESYMRAYPPVADGRYKVANDLFDGIMLNSTFGRSSTVHEA
jgi:LmbE family N-acetylglucosaminyl deacetylase